MSIYERVKKYMCNNLNNNERSDGKNCIAEVLKVIDVLQKNACPENCSDSCDRPILGGGTNCYVFNTRPVQLFTCCGNGIPFSMPVCKDFIEVCSTTTGLNPSENCSTIFRVEKLEGNCCTFRVLVPNTDTTNCNIPWLATNSFFTFDCDCLCAIRCLSDCFVECV